jgi:D-arabinose 1-dehydrogenase-like Zn-dependent alcohol dehydrogenase
VAIETMLEFASRHDVAPQTEHFPMSKINDAFARLGSRTPDIAVTQNVRFLLQDASRIA